MTSSTAPNGNSFKDDLKYFSNKYFQGVESDLSDSSVEKKITNIASNLEELKPEDLHSIDDKVKLRIFQKAITGKDDFSQRIQALLKDQTVSQLLEQNPEDPHMLSFCLSFDHTEESKHTLKLKHNTYLSQAQIEGLLKGCSDSDRVQIKMLDLSGSEGLIDLNFLNFFPNLQTLRLNSCSNLETLSGIENLSSTLQHLSLESCFQLKDLDPIETCRSLVSLNANSCTGLESIGKIKAGKIGEGSGLAEHQTLEELELSHCNLLLGFNFETIKTLTGLRVLKLAHLPLVVDISWLAGFKNLQELDLSYTSIQDATHLNHLSQEAQQRVNFEGCDLLQTYPAWYVKP